MTETSEFSIIGGGVAGLATAIMLQKQNRELNLFEKATALHGIGAGFGLAANAMQALELLGIRKDVEQHGYYLDSYAILNQKGETLVHPQTQHISKRYNQSNFAIHRADLHLYLLSQVPTEKVHLNKAAIKLEKAGEYLRIHFSDGSSHLTKYLILADGIKSALRQQLLPDSTARYSGYTCWRATIDNTQIKLSHGTETWGKAGRFGMTPLVQDRIYWYACINGAPNSETFRNFRVQDLQARFASYHQPIPQILEATRDEQLIWSDIMDIKPLSHFALGNILLLGDAAHACTPNLGQGACQALEDVAVLQDELQQDKDVQEAFKSFEKRRLARTAYIIKTSKMVGEVAQWENPLMIALRNGMMKIMPNNMGNQALNKLFKEDFMDL